MTDTRNFAPPGNRLTELVSRMCDDGLTPEETAALEAMLQSDPAARRFYYEFIHCHGQLCWPSAELHGRDGGIAALASSPSSFTGEDSAHSPSPLMGEGRRAVSLSNGGEGSDGSSPAALPAIILPESTPPAPATKSPVLGFLGGVVDYVIHSRTLMFWLISVGLVAFFTAHFGSLLLSRFWDQNAQVADNGVGAHGGPGGAADRAKARSGKFVASLTNAIDCQWTLSAAGSAPGRIDKPKSLALGTEFSAGQKLDLATGLAEITFNSGAQIILHAPAQFTVSEERGGDLQLGRLTAKVPHSAAGFTVSTPSGKVVDLGTEFGVKVSGDRTMHVTVFVGEVVVNPGSGSGSSGAAAEGPNSVHVKTGEAVVVTPGQPVKSVSGKDERFVRDLAQFGGKEDAGTAYVELMKKLKPAVWFRMEGREKDRVLHDEASTIADAKLDWDGPGNPFVKGRIGKGLWLRGPTLKDYAIVPDYPKAEHGKLSVVAWVYADSPSNFATIATNWFSGKGQGQFHLALVSAFSEHDVNYRPDAVSLWVEIAQADGKTIDLREGNSHLFPANEWQHVAFTTDGSTLRLYRQGKEVASWRHEGLQYPVALRNLGVGVKTDETGQKADGVFPGYWSGKLDELAIFNETLTAEDIEKLAAAAPR